MAIAGTAWLAADQKFQQNVAHLTVTSTSVSLPAGVATSVAVSSTAQLTTGNVVAQTGAAQGMTIPFTIIDSTHLSLTSLTTVTVISGDTLHGAKSLAAGYMGSDFASSVDLGATRALWLLADTFWATAADQDRNHCTFIHNCVALQTGSYDLSASTLTFYRGAWPGALALPSAFAQIPPGESGYSWGGPALLLDTTLVVMQNRQGANGVFNEGCDVYVYYNVTGTPDTWSRVRVPFPADGIVTGSPILTDPSDGWVYGYYPVKTTTFSYSWFAMRWVRNQAKAGRFLYPQYWTGVGWTYNPATPRVPVITGAQNDGNFYLRSDGKWITYQSKGQFNGDIGYSLQSAGATPQGPFPALTSIFTPFDSTNAFPFVYAGKGHPEQTWSGKGATECMVTWAAGAATGASVFTDHFRYWPRCAKVTGI